MNHPPAPFALTGGSLIRDADGAKVARVRNTTSGAITLLLGAPAALMLLRCLISTSTARDKAFAQLIQAKERFEAAQAAYLRVAETHTRAIEQAALFEQNMPRSTPTQSDRKQ